MRLRLELRHAEQRVRVGVRDRARGRRAGRRAERGVLHHELDVLPDLVEGEREVSQHLRAVDPALAHALVEGGGEQELPVELVGRDLHQDLVVVGAAIEGEEALHDLHVLDHVVEGLVVAGLGGVGLGRVALGGGAAGFGRVLLVRRGGVGGEGGPDSGQPEQRQDEQDARRAGVSVHLGLLWWGGCGSSTGLGTGSETLTGRLGEHEMAGDRRGISPHRREREQGRGRGSSGWDREGGRRAVAAIPPGGGPGAGVKPCSQRSTVTEGVPARSKPEAVGPASEV